MRSLTALPPPQGPIALLLDNRRLAQSAAKGVLRLRGVGLSIAHLIPAPTTAPAEYTPLDRETHSLRCAPAPVPATKLPLGWELAESQMKSRSACSGL
jgi:hypothetical protein